MAILDSHIAAPRAQRTCSVRALLRVIGEAKNQTTEHEEEIHVSTIELFFDLVFVFTITVR